MLPLTSPTYHILNWNYYCITPTKPVPLPLSYQWKVASSVQVPYRRNQESASDGRLLAAICNCPEHQTDSPVSLLHRLTATALLQAFINHFPELWQQSPNRIFMLPDQIPSLTRFSSYSLCLSKRDYPHNHLRNLVVLLDFQKYKSDHP